MAELHTLGLESPRSEIVNRFSRGGKDRIHLSGSEPHGWCKRFQEVKDI